MVGALASIGLVGFTTTSALATSGGQPVIYSSVVASPGPGNLPSVGAEAYAFNELGNQVNFSGTNRTLTSVVVSMSSWGCVSGNWTNDTCVTPTGATFSEPITLNIYNPPAAGSDLPGSLITSVTQTFAIPYRPSANNSHCNFKNSDSGYGPPSGEWWDASLKTCFNGLAVNVTFDVPNVTVPNTVVYGIVYNTSHYGPTPYGQTTACYTSSGGCGYDSLNIALSLDPTNVNVGSDTNIGTVWQNTSYAPFYCDNGVAGTGFFRLDSPTTASSNPDACASQSGGWSAGGGVYYVPAVKFVAHS